VDTLWLLTFFIGAALQVLLLIRLQRGAYKSYPILFLYCLLLFLSTVVEIAVFRDRTSGLYRNYYRDYYWINDAVLQLLILGVMMSFLHRAMKENPSRRVVSMVVGAVILAVVSYSYLSAATNHFTALARNLSFASALMNLALWMALLKGARNDVQLLLLSAGIGVQTAGKAIGHSLREMSRATQSTAGVEAGNILIVAVHLMCLFIWWWALGPAFSRAPRAAAPQESFDRGRTS
jgi:hypothetical protein